MPKRNHVRFSLTCVYARISTRASLCQISASLSVRKQLVNMKRSLPDTQNALNIIGWINALFRSLNLLFQIGKTFYFVCESIFYTVHECDCWTSETGFSRCLPTVPCLIPLRRFWLHVPTFKWQSTTRKKQPNLLTENITRKSISSHLRIFNPINWKQKLTGETMKY